MTASVPTTIRAAKAESMAAFTRYVQGIGTRTEASAAFKWEALLKQQVRVGNIQAGQ